MCTYLWVHVMLCGCNVSAHACKHTVTYMRLFTACAPTSIWYRRISSERHVWGPVGNSEKPVLCQNSTGGAQEQRIVGHGHVYLPRSHPDQQICWTGPEKHGLCKLSRYLARVYTRTHSHIKISLVFVPLPKNWNLRAQWQWACFLTCVCAYPLFTFVEPL